jgi:pyruvate,water dikinase
MSRSLLVVIPKLKGIVAEVGGVFAVASGAARWFKVPAVVGVDGITKKIKDGDFIRINGDTGTVEIIPETALASAV